MRFCVAKLYVIILIMLIAGVNIKTLAQNNDEVKTMFTQAQKQYSDSNYTQAIEICNRILTTNPELVGVEMLLSYIYDDTNKPELELLHLNKALKLNEHPYIKWRLGEAYYKMGNYSEAVYYYNIYSSYKYINEKTRLTLACKRASSIFIMQSLKNYADDNQLDYNEFYWPTQSSDSTKLIFIQENGIINEVKQDNIFSNLDTLNNQLEVQLEEAKITSKVISAKEKIIFFTGYNREDGYGDSDIYFSHLIDGKWSTPVNAGNSINSKKAEFQPNYNIETKQLYFTSNRSGGAGEKDIWRSKLLQFADNGLPVWSTPENLRAVNTTGNEISPFIHSKNQQLYFASDSHFGMGGYDLYKADVEESGTVGEIINLGYPINTKADELGLIVSYISDTAFFTSARAKDEGLEIFAFNLTRGLRTGPNFYVYIKVNIQNSNSPIKTNIEIVEEKNNSAENNVETVNENGERMLCLKANRTYTFNISERGYMYYSKTISLDKSNSISNPLELNIKLEPIEVGSEIDLHNIYYETNSFAILPMSESELSRIVTFLNNNNRLIVEIQGHTDSSGDSENNMLLSESRAKSVVDYLVAKGINSSRLKHSGYGDTVPIASNETEEGRQLNRRTTIKIIEK